MTGHPLEQSRVAPSHAGPFSDRQIGLLQTFADQAVIAIENVRLFDAEQQRTHELSEALDQQTATSEVLQVISRSAFDLQTVLDTLVASAARLCGTEHCMIFRHEDGFLRAAAAYNTPRELLELWERTPIPAGRGTATARALLERRPVHIPDVLRDPEYDFHEAQRLGAYRTVLAVPLLRDGIPLGTMVLWKTEVEPFTHKQIEVVTTFADQAVIAIENVRLFDAEQQRTHELTASLQQQTATADVLKVISRSAFDLETVLNTLVELAARLCDAYDAVILLREGGSLVFGAHHGPIPIDFVKHPLTRAWTAGRSVLDRTAVHVHDLAAAADEFPEGHALALRMGHRTILSVPLLREEEAIGSLSIRRTEARPFTHRQIELVTTFADQAVIAIENVRLFDEVQARTRELSESLEQQTATSEVLSVISRSPGELEPVFQTMLEKATRICGARFGTLWLCEEDGLRVVSLHNAPPAFAEERRTQPCDSSWARESSRPGDPNEAGCSSCGCSHGGGFHSCPCQTGGSPNGSRCSLAKR